MFLSLQTFLPLLLFCGYGVIGSLGCDNVTADIHWEDPMQINFALLDFEKKCDQPAQLFATFDTAYKNWPRDQWWYSNEYVKLSREFYELLRELEAKMQAEPEVTIVKYYEMKDFRKICTDPESDQTMSLINLRRMFSIPKTKYEVFYSHIERNGLKGDKAVNFCKLLIREFERPSCNVTIKNNDTLRLYGSHVRLSDVQKVVDEYRERDFRNIEIFASSKLIINSDIVLMTNKSVNFIIMATEWMLPTHYFAHSPRGIKLLSKENESLFFGMAYSFIDTDKLLTIEMDPRPPSHEYITLHQVGVPSARQFAITGFGEEPYEANPAQTGCDYHGAMNFFTRLLLDTKGNEVANNFLRLFYTSPRVSTNMFDTFGFAGELLTLEDHFFTLYRKSISAIEVYKNLNKQFEDYSLSPKFDEMSWEFDELRDSIRTAIQSKKEVVASTDKFEFNLNKYVSNGVSDLMKMDDIIKREQDKKITSLKEKIRAEIRADVKQAEGFIQDVISETQDLNERIDVQLDAVIQTAKAARQKLINDVQRREQQKTKLMLYTVLKSIGTLVVTLACSSIGGPWVGGVMAGAAIGFFTDVIGEPEVDEVNVPAAIRNVQSFVEAKSRVFDHMLEILGDNEPTLLGALKKQIKDAQEAMNDGKNAAPFEKISKLLKTKEQELQADGSSKALDIVRQLQKILRYSQSTTADTYLKYRNDSAALQVLDNNRYNDDDVKVANVYEQQIHILVAPAIKYFSNFTTNLANSTAGKSLAEIEVLRSAAHNILQDINARVSELAAGTVEGKSLLESVSKLSTALNLIFDISDKIKFHQLYMRLTDYIADISAVPHNTREYENKEIEESLSKLKYLTKYNQMITRYKTFVNSFKLFTFPFTSMLSGLTDFDFSQEYTKINSVRDMAIVAGTKLTTMSSRLQMYKNSLTDDKDISLLTGRFDGSESNNEVFYTWKLGKHTSQLNQLLRGSPVHLHSVVHGGLRKNAIKFKRIGIRVKVASPEMQAKLDDVLGSFYVTMTHSGISYYLCDGQGYRFTSAKTTFRYSYARDEDGEPLVTDDTYDKLVNGNYLLSPYTMWTIKLEPKKPAGGRKLRDLGIREAEITLEGDGQFVEGKDACSDDLRRYYNVVNNKRQKKRISGGTRKDKI